MEIGTANKSKLQQTLIRFLKGDFCRLRMTWGTDAERREHIVLLQDSGRFVMAWIQEEKRTVQYHVADVKTYLDVEEKKYPKDTFQGQIIPAYLIHEGVTALRNALELLLAELDESDTVTGKFAEYAGENPVKERPTKYFGRSWWAIHWQISEKDSRQSLMYKDMQNFWQR